MEIIWEDPSATALARNKPGKYVEFAVALREHPKKWARLPGEPRTEKGAAGAAQNIKRGQTAGFARGEYDAVPDEIEVEGQKEWHVYVQFLGEVRAPAAKPTPSGEPGGSGEEDGNGGHDMTAGEQPRRSATPDVVRAWAREHGYTVPDRGRLPETIWEAYDARDEH